MCMEHQARAVAVGGGPTGAAFTARARPIFVDSLLCDGGHEQGSAQRAWHPGGMMRFSEAGSCSCCMLRLLGVCRGRVEKQCSPVRGGLEEGYLDCWLLQRDIHAVVIRLPEDGRLAGSREGTPSELSPTDRIGIL